MSVFIELKFHEDKIEESLKAQHYKQNKALFDDMKGYGDVLDTKMIKINEDIQRIKGNLESNSGSSLISVDLTLKELKKEREVFENDYKNIKKEIATYRPPSQVIELENELDNIDKELQQKNTEFDLEVNGVKLARVNGKIIKSTGIKSKGKRAKKLEAIINTLKNQRRIVEKRLGIASKKYGSGSELLVEEKAVIAKKIKAIDGRIDERRREIHRFYINSKDEIRNDLKEELDSKKKELSNLQENRDTLISKNTKRILSSPEYVEYRDGPMMRMVTLEKLYQDEYVGDAMRSFSWVFKGFLMFLEVLPILMKLFFSPATVYGTALQVLIKDKTRKVIDGEGIDSIEDIDAMIELEKKKMAFLDAKEKRLYQEKYIDAIKDIDSKTVKKSYRSKTA